MPTSARPTLALVLLALGTLPLGCARDRSQITPTTTGTDLRNIPRGRMTPLPFPGSSLARASKTPANPLRPGSDPKADASTVTTSDEARIR